MSDLRIRQATRDDVPAINDLYNLYVGDSAVTFDVVPWPLEQRLEWFGQFGATGAWRLLVAESGGSLAGYAGTSQFRAKEAYGTSVEVTIYVHPEFQGRGVGAMLYDALFEALEAEAVHRAYAGITLPNESSILLHERAGFRHIGTWHEVGFKLGRYWDVAWYERSVNTGQ